MRSSSTAPEMVAERPPRSPVVVVIGSDTSLRCALEVLSRDEGWRLETAASIRALLDHEPSFASHCLVLDASQLGSDDHLLRYFATDMPVICIADAGDAWLSVRAMKAGVIEVLPKPVAGTALLKAVRLALIQSEESRKQEVELNELRERYALLSRREREVMALVVSGLMNKQVGRELGISEVTVKAHRGRMMRKMNAAWLPLS